MLLRRACNLIRVACHGPAGLSALAFTAAVVAAGCSDTSSVVGPNPDPVACTFDLAPAAQTIGILTASGSVAVATTSECTWNATTDAGWITLTLPTSGRGNGMVNFVASGNTGFDPRSERTGSIIVAGQRSTITQGGPGPSCSFTIDPGSQIIGAAGGSGAPVGVSSKAALCPWTAASTAPWITVTAGASGIGNGVVAFSVAANTGAAREGTLTIAGRTATIGQTAADAPPPPQSSSACPSTISPDIQGVGLLGGTFTVRVTTPGTCAWTAASNEEWITIVSGASGTGNGVVTFIVRPNNNIKGPSRRGTLTIAGRTATIIN
jgi:hypothetical protein